MHWPITVASFRTWRGSRDYIARDPASDIPILTFASAKIPQVPGTTAARGENERTRFRAAGRETPPIERTSRTTSLRNYLLLKFPG